MHCDVDQPRGKQLTMTHDIIPVRKRVQKHMKNYKRNAENNGKTGKETNFSSRSLKIDKRKNKQLGELISKVNNRRKLKPQFMNACITFNVILFVFA